MRRYQTVAVLVVVMLLAALSASAQTGGYPGSQPGCIPGAYRDARCGYGGAGGNLPAYERWNNGAPATGSGSSDNSDQPLYFRGIGSVHDFGR